MREHTPSVGGRGWVGARSDDARADGGTLRWVGLCAAAEAVGLTAAAGQAWVLRSLVAHPWRWVGANTLAWTGAMPVIFLGATAPGADWAAYRVVALGTVTGAAAGAVLGMVTGWFLPSLDGRRRAAPQGPVSV